MSTNPKEINVQSHTHTLESGIEINPLQSLLPVLLVGDRVLVEPIPDDEFISKEANIKAPVRMDRQFQKCKVMSIGGGEYGYPLPASLKVGITCNYWHKSAIEFVLDKKKYHLIRASDCFMYL